MKSKVTMICREIWRVTVVVEHPIGKSQEAIKDEAWTQFDEKKLLDLEQENYTKIEEIPEDSPRRKRRGVVRLRATGD